MDYGDQVFSQHTICVESWWRNLIYINNFQYSYDMCMPWSFYLANDMQFYLVSPIFLIMFEK